LTIACPGSKEWQILPTAKPIMSILGNSKAKFTVEEFHKNFKKIPEEVKEESF